MTTLTRKWGNSLAIRIPKIIAEKAMIRQGTKIDFEIDREGNIKIKNLDKDRSLEKYMEKITSENLHSEVVSDEFKNESWEY